MHRRKGRSVLGLLVSAAALLMVACGTDVTESERVLTAGDDAGESREPPTADPVTTEPMEPEPLPEPADDVAMEADVPELVFREVELTEPYEVVEVHTLFRPSGDQGATIDADEAVTRAWTEDSSTLEAFAPLAPDGGEIFLALVDNVESRDQLVWVLRVSGMEWWDFGGKAAVAARFGVSVDELPAAPSALSTGHFLIDAHTGEYRGIFVTH